MGKENWGHRGMPPIYVEVLHKQTLHQGEQYSLERYWLQGGYPHYGRVFRGWSGTETEVVRETIGERVRIIKDRQF